MLELIQSCLWWYELVYEQITPPPTCIYEAITILTVITSYIILIIRTKVFRPPRRRQRETSHLLLWQQKQIQCWLAGVMEMIKKWKREMWKMKMWQVRRKMAASTLRVMAIHWTSYSSRMLLESHHQRPTGIYYLPLLGSREAPFTATGVNLESIIEITQFWLIFQCSIIMKRCKT